MIDDAKVSAVMVDLEKFELRSAVEIWDSLSGELKDTLVSLPKRRGAINGWFPEKDEEDPRAESLILMGLAVCKNELIQTFLSGGSISNPEPWAYTQLSYMTTPIGEIVRRYGVAVRTIAAAKEACK